MEKIDKCPLCNNEKFEKVYNLKDYRMLVDEIEFKIVKCVKCNLKFLNPRPDENEIKKYYPEKYYIPKDKKDLINDNIKILKAKYNKIPKNKGKILDIGAQKGEFLEFCKRNRWEVFANDISDKIPNPYNIMYKYGNIWEIEYPENEFDCITMWHVFEHISYPDETLKKIYKWLKKMES